MGYKSSNLFSEFKPVSLAEWESKLEKDLKGKPLDSLRFSPEFDLSVKAYYHPEEFSTQKYSKGSILNADNNDWAITESFTDKNSKRTNEQIHKSLNKGVTGIKVTLTDYSVLSDLLEGILVEHVFTHFVCLSSYIYKQLIQYLAETKTKLSIIEMPFLTHGLEEGTFSLNQLDIDNFIKDSAAYAIKNTVVDGHSFCQFGASTAQELGIVLSQLNEYIQRLANQKISVKNWHEKFAVHLGITDNYFVNIAKFRAIKELVLQLQSQWGMDTDTMPWVSAETVNRTITLNDRQNNILRQTTTAMSAILGGISQLIIRPYSEITNNDHELSSRLAKNIQLVLKDEAYLSQVIDAGAGSYLIESLTDQLISKSWDYFLAIESEGGYYKAVENEFIHSMLETSKKTQITALSNGDRTLLGVNKYQNSAETWQLSTRRAEKGNLDFKGFAKFNLESNFKNETV